MGLSYHGRPLTWDPIAETKGRSLEDINAQFGEQVAIRYYGATEQEKAEMEAAAEADEKAEVGHVPVADEKEDAKAQMLEVV